MPAGALSDPPNIGDNVEFGANVVVIGPITIGDNAIIGAGSVVVKDIPANGVAVGNPARIIRLQGDPGAADEPDANAVSAS